MRSNGNANSQSFGSRLTVAACGAIYMTAWFNLLKLVGLHNPQGPVTSLLLIVLPFGVLLVLVAALVRFY